MNISRWGRNSPTYEEHRRDQRRRVVIIGPGKVGCGYLAPLFLDAGWDTVLAARTSARAERIRAGGFHVRLNGSEGTRSITCPVVPFGSTLFDGAVADADLVVTSVGVDNVASLGPPLARALAARGTISPIDIWVVENGDVAPVLEQAVHSAARNAAIELPPVGFAGAIARPVIARGDWKGAAKPVFVSDGDAGLLIDESRLTQHVPELAGVSGSWEYRARLQEKLVVFGAGHALCAYLGALCGYQRIDQAARDPLLRTLLQHGLLEARSALLRTNRELGNDVWRPVLDAMRRYEHAGLKDPIRRVARNPIRKLSPSGPILGATQLIRDVFGRVPRGFALGVASALLYRDAADRQSNELEGRLRREGICSVLRDVCDIDPGGRFGHSVVVAYRRMSQVSWDAVMVKRIGARPGRTLLPLDVERLTAARHVVAV